MDVQNGVRHLDPFQHIQYRDGRIRRVPERHSQRGGLIQGSTDVTPDMLADLETTLEAMDVGSLLGLFMQSILINVTMTALNIIIFVLVYGRMIEIYLLTSLAPIPVATLSNREIGGTGQNYLKSLFAVAFQGMLILVCVAIYAVLIQGHRHKRRPYRGRLGDYWLHGAALLHAVQNGRYRPACLWRSLKRKVIYDKKILLLKKGFPQSRQTLWEEEPQRSGRISAAPPPKEQSGVCGDEARASPRMGGPWPRTACSSWTASRGFAPCPAIRWICS